MRTPLHAFLRAAGLGILGGALLGALLGLAVVHLGINGFYGLCLSVGIGAIAASHVLERRARRAGKGKNFSHLNGEAK
ncbi:hypothetical protein [Pseudoduganella dura]|uniref:hypothetical protein n=1 Tax=Pseudoduganella dura TaxID=321982 RepID=UPI0016785F58|nr:hypothetical protein [Pseudoduganella dura]GGX99011.1 hypothetical protein GCM10007386_32420 [Pseudoduganella dura]